MSSFQNHYPWTKSPLIASAPMRLIAGPELAVAVSKAGGLGFIGSGNDQSNLATQLAKATQLSQEAGLPSSPTLPIGIGFINWGANLDTSLLLIEKYRPAAIWLFAARDIDTLILWSSKVREETQGQTKIWVQLGSVKEAVDVAKRVAPDVLVLQGGDAGGHGLNAAASIVSLVPEAVDALRDMEARGDITKMPYIVATGGICDGRGVAAAHALGADGASMGTRYLASPEAVISKGYRDAVLGASDGGQTTVRSGVYDRLRGTTDWGSEYGGRGVINQSYHDAIAGMDWEENTKMYGKAVERGDAAWGDSGRMTTYAGTGVGLVKKVQGAGEITEEVRVEAINVVDKLSKI